MITRAHKAPDGTTSTAEFSDCGRYRYSLTRTWDAQGPRVLYVMLNPSKADELRNDPTIERCERRARALGYGAFRAVNIFAWRDTDPAALKRADAPIGPENDAKLADALRWTGDIIAAWGVHGAHLDRGPQVARMLHLSGKPLLAFGETKAGHPRHPLYISYTQSPQAWMPD
jgi:hypothetical protein